MSTAEHTERSDSGEDEEATSISVASIDPFEARGATEAPKDAKPILTVDNLRMYFPVKSQGLIHRTVGNVQAVDGVSFEVVEGGSLGLVGESGCGKSTTGRLITRLLTPTSGSILFEGRDIAQINQRQLKPLRREIQMIFQDPYTSLNPRHTVGSIVGAPLRIHKIVPEKQVLTRVKELLEIVGLNPEHYNRFPNEFSGGQRQRIGIARALTLNPKLLVADEPVSALDVSIQAQVVNLLQGIQQEFGVAFLFIAHDLAIVRHFCPEVAVMYLGKIVEIGDRESIYLNAASPLHPGTALRGARRQAGRDRRPPRADPAHRRRTLTRSTRPLGCRFRTRCPIAQEICAKVEPPLLQIGPKHKVACHFPGPIGHTPRSRPPPRCSAWTARATPTPPGP